MDQQQPTNQDYQEDSPFNLAEGNTTKLIVGILAVIILITGTLYYFLFYRNGIKSPRQIIQKIATRSKSASPTPTQSTQTPVVTTKPPASSLGEINQGTKGMTNAQTDINTDTKDNVNYVHSLIKHFFVEYGSYPQTLKDLQALFAIDDASISFYSTAPYYYKKSTKTYEYYAQIGNQTFKGDINGINKNLDTSVTYTIDQITQSANNFYSSYQRFPQNLDELQATLGVKFLKNPYTQKPNAYTVLNNGTQFQVVGTLSNGQQYIVQ